MNNWNLFFLITFSIIGSFNCGYFLSELNAIGVGLKSFFQNDSFETKIALLQSAVTFLAIIGSLIMGPIATNFGTLFAFYFADLLTITGCALTFFKGFPQLLIGRLCKGIATGLYSSAIPFYLSEYAPNDYKGSIVSLHQLFVNVGILFTFIISNYSSNWEFILYFPIFQTILRFLVFLFPLRCYDPKKSSCTNHISNQNSVKFVSYSELFQPIYRKRLFISLGGNIFQQLSGVNILVFYSVSVFDQAAKNLSNHQEIAIYYSFLFSFFLTVSTPFGGYFVDKFGSKAVSTIGAIFQFIFLSAFTFSMSIANLKLMGVFACLYAIAFSVSWGVVIWIIAAELLPEKGIGLSVCCNFLFASIIGGLYPILEKQIGMDVILYACSICNILAAFFSQKLILNTKGMTKIEIENFYEEEFKKENPNYFSNNDEKEELSLLKENQN